MPITPADEATFIQLWTQGASYADIARALGCALGTVGSRAATLVRQGKIQPRPRGGSYPKQRALARQEGTPALHPRHPREAPAPPPAMAPAEAPAPHPRVDIKQWTVRLSQALIEAVKTTAATQRKEPSHLVEELLWHALSDRRSSTS